MLRLALQLLVSMNHPPTSIASSYFLEETLETFNSAGKGSGVYFQGGLIFVALGENKQINWTSNRVFFHEIYD